MCCVFFKNYFCHSVQKSSKFLLWRTLFEFNLICKFETIQIDNLNSIQIENSNPIQIDNSNSIQITIRIQFKHELTTFGTEQIKVNN